jgi:CBS domain-containing protein
MIVGDIMTREPITVGEDTPLDIVAGLMIENRIGCIPVVDEGGGVRGIITEADFTGNERNVPFGAFVLPHLFDAPPEQEQLELVRSQARHTTAAQIMCAPVETVGADEPLGAVVRRMVERQRQRLPVVQGGRLVGIVSRHDLLRVIAPQELPSSAEGSTAG